MSLEQIFLDKYPHKRVYNVNQKDRPSLPDGIVIHSMGQYIEGYGHASDFLEELGLSAHYLIEADGTVLECVDPERQAYHAGKSEFKGETGLNSTFVGIELLVEGEYNYGTFLKAIKDPDSFTLEQADSAAVMCSLLNKWYDIPTDRIVRHSDVSGSDVRDDPKKDPGSGFDWQHFINLTGEFIDQLKA